MAKKYNRYSLALTDEENERFKMTGVGVKKIFKAMLDVLSPVKKESTTVIEEVE